MFANKEDLGRATITKEVKEYCQIDTCRREYLATHFGTSVMERVGHHHTCCDNCTKLCNCDACLTSGGHDTPEDLSDDGVY